ncbi:MAG: hypothetical protein ABIA59_07455, partial [Candidatus Latescibacterota bacterium]
MMRWPTVSFAVMLLIASQQADARVLRREPVRTPVASIALEFGGVSSLSDDAVDGFPYTEFNNGFLYGGCINFFLPNKLSSSGAPMAVGFEIGISRYEMELEEKPYSVQYPDEYYSGMGIDFGDLEVTPLTFLLKFQQFPSRQRQFAFNLDAGFGIFFSNFKKGYLIKELEIQDGTVFTIDTDQSPFFQFGAGADFFLAENLSIAFCGKFLIGNIGTSWDVQ